MSKLSKKDLEVMEKAIIACSELNASDLVEMFEDVLEKIGYNIYEHPDFEGSDMVGFIVSKAKLTPKQIKGFSEEED